MTTKLANRRCSACTGETSTLLPAQVHALLQEVSTWRLSKDGTRISRIWIVRDFLTGLDFFRRIADVAEAEDHHPDLHLTNYREVVVELWTHAVGGLTENDFIVAAKIDELEPPQLKG